MLLLSPPPPLHPPLLLYCVSRPYSLHPLAAQDECDDINLWQYNSTCYSFNPGSLNFEEARARCEEFDTKLVEIDSEELNEFLKAKVNAFWSILSQFRTFHPQYNYEGAWIGARRDSPSSDWQWVQTGTGVSVTDWAEDAATVAGSGAKCAVMRNDFNESWVEEDCQSRRPIGAICQQSVDPPQQKCLNGYCYRLLTMLTPFNRADFRCQYYGHFGSIPAYVGTQEEMEFIQGFLDEATFNEPQQDGKANVWVRQTQTVSTEIYHGDCWALDASDGWKKIQVPCSSRNAVLCVDDHTWDGGATVVSGEVIHP